MLDPFASWNRIVAVGVKMAQTGFGVADTLAAAGEVVAARTSLIKAAQQSPLSADVAELSRMVPEKVDAFSQAGSAAVNIWWSAQSAWFEQMQYFGGLVTRGRIPTPVELLDIANRGAGMGLDAMEASASMGANVLAPVRKAATANARRLKGKAKSRRSRKTHG